MGEPETSQTQGLRLPRMIFFAIVLAALAQCVLTFSQLPDRVASHFTASGAPNGWMTKETFFVVYAVMVGLAAFVEVYPARSIARSSPARINLPNKEYWLAPERRNETLAYFQKYFAWYGCVFALIEVLVMGLAIQANLTPLPRLPTGPIAAIIAGFVLFNIASVIQILRRFSKPS